MTEETLYKCETCGNTIKSSDDTNPICCGASMEKVSLDPCTQPAHAEHARPMDEENACDEFRAAE